MVTPWNCLPSLSCIQIFTFVEVLLVIVKFGDVVFPSILVTIKFDYSIRHACEYMIMFNVYWYQNRQIVKLPPIIIIA